MDCDDSVYEPPRKKAKVETEYFTTLNVKLSQPESLIVQRIKKSGYS